jgi:3-keto-disaccharide hydrolase
MKKIFYLFPVLLVLCFTAVSAQEKKMKHEDTELYTPVPPVVTSGKSCGDAPSDAIVLFSGKNLDQWVSANDTTKPADWIVKKGILTVNKKAGSIQTKQLFMDYQIHIEWREPKDIEGSDQARGNSGLFLASTGKGDEGYEMQILDNYNNKTYTNGQAGSIYKQNAPLVNPNRPPGEWQTYDVIWTAPRFNDDGSLKSPARVTAFFNGVLVQNNFELIGPTIYVGHPSYTGKGAVRGPYAIKLQAHGDTSKPISFRNIWVRPL